jgi:hypothetical protein
LRAVLAENRRFSRKIEEKPGKASTKRALAPVQYNQPENPNEH